MQDLSHFQVMASASGESFFSVSLSQITWFGDHVAIQITGMCPAANRSKEDMDYLQNEMIKQEQQEYDQNQYRHSLGGDERDFNETWDRVSMSQYTESAMGTSRGRSREGKEKKYQVRVEVRCSNQEILNILRTDIENLIVRDLSLGHFIMSWWN